MALPGTLSMDNPIMMGPVDLVFVKKDRDQKKDDGRYDESCYRSHYLSLFELFSL